MNEFAQFGESKRLEGSPPGMPLGPRTDPQPAPESMVMTTTELDREIAEAMAAMDPTDLAELSGEPIRGDADSAEPGTELVGAVVGVSGDEVFLQFGVKSQGVLPRSQFGKKELIDIGRRVDVVVDRFDVEGNLLIVNRKGSIQRATWTNLTVGMIVSGKVTGLNKGGLEIDLKGIRAFMPASQVDPVPMKDISVLLGETIQAEVIELDRRHKNVLLSRRRVIEKERAAAREKLQAELAPGQMRRGIVGNVVEFGAFVDLGGVDGLIHIRDMSWASVEKATDVLSPGQEVEVVILKVDAERSRISLGLKQAQPDPWKGVPERYPVGTSLKARVVRLAEFGAFAELEPGVEGLIPISEMGWTRTKRSSDVAAVGDMVDVKVLRLEADKRRIALSMKQSQPDPWEGVFESYAVGSLVHGRVGNLAAFGAFVELGPGVEGLIHISELSDRRVNSCHEVVTPGQEVEVRVLGVDREQRRISLSIKQVKEPTQALPAAEVAAVAAPPAKPVKKRKKPLRGGLSGNWDW